MKIEHIWTTAIIVIIGYLIGSISNSVIISKFFHQEDIRTKGSGNAGATNALRVYGRKIGGLVFLLDVCKPILAIGIAFALKRNAGIAWEDGVVVQAAGLAAVIGHIWPVFFKFKGGKGAACTVGFVIGMNWLLVFLGIAVFLIIVKLTKKVALGSIITPGVILLVQIIFGVTATMNQAWSNPMMNDGQWWINSIFLAVIWSLLIIKHIPNIQRMLSGTENTTDKFKK